MAYYTQNQKIEQVSNDAMVVGVDIGSKTQHARAFDYRGREVSKVLKFTNSRSGFELFLAWMRSLVSEKDFKKIIVGMEPTGHYWFNLRDFLAKEGIMLVLFAPLHVKQSKELDDGSQTKNDRKDPKVIARLVCEGRYSVPYTPEGVYADLRIVWQDRERQMSDLIRAKNRITEWISTYFPEYAEVFKDVFSKSSLTLLRKACTPSDMLELGADGIKEIWHDEKVRAASDNKVKNLLAAAEQSIGCHRDSDVVRRQLAGFIREYDFHVGELETLEAQLAELLEQIPEAAYLLNTKGVGLVTVAGLLAEAGDLRRFKSPKQLLKLSGLSLRENSSGKHKGETTISKRGRARLRKVIFNGALAAIRFNAEFRQVHEYYTKRLENPLKHKQSVIAVGCKLVRVLYSLFVHGRSYDGQRMLADIHRPLQAA